MHLRYSCIKQGESEDFLEVTYFISNMQILLILL